MRSRWGDAGTSFDTPSSRRQRSDTESFLGPDDSFSTARRSLSSASTASCNRSSNAGERSISLRLSAEKTLSMDWHSASISRWPTARAAPFRLWASRNTVSMTSSRFSATGVFSNSISPEDNVCTCSPASTLKVARSFLRKASPFLSMSAEWLHLILVHQLFQLLPQFTQVLRRALGLLSARHILHARLLDVLHRQGHLVHAHRLLLRRGCDLDRRLRRLLDAVGQHPGRLAHLPRLASLLGGHYRTTGRLLDVPQDRPHLRRSLLRLLRKAFHLLRHHGETLALFARLRRLDRSVDGKKIGLFRQIIHRGGDLADGLALFTEPHNALRDRLHLLLDAVHRLDGIFDEFLAGLRNLHRLLRGLGHILGFLGGNLGRLLHFLHGDGGLTYRGGRLRRSGSDLRG